VQENNIVIFVETIVKSINRHIEKKNSANERYRRPNNALFI